MSDELLRLIEKARQVRMTPQEIEEQRISFVYGNLHYEDQRISREDVARYALKHRGINGSDAGPQS